MTFLNNKLLYRQFDSRRNGKNIFKFVSLLKKFKYNLVVILIVTMVTNFLKENYFVYQQYCEIFRNRLVQVTCE